MSRNGEAILSDSTPGHPNFVVYEGHFPSSNTTVVVRGKIQPKDSPSAFNLPLSQLLNSPPKPRVMKISFCFCANSAK